MTDINLDLRDDPAIGIFLQGGLKHERGLLELLSRFLRPDDVFYDIGANHGYYSLLLSEPSYRLRQIVAFEPAPGLAEEIKRNAVNRSNVLVMAVGLSAEDGLGVLRCKKNRSSVANFRPGFTGASVEVPLLTLDGLILSGQIQPANVIKIDVEGFEYKVLQGYSLRDVHKPAIFMEWVSDFSAEIGVTFRDLQQLLGKGWIIYRIENNGTLREESIEKPGTTNDLLLVWRDTTYHELAQGLIQSSRTARIIRMSHNGD